MITREDKIEQSTEDFAREALDTRGYVNFYELLDAFPYTAAALPDSVHADGVLSKNVVAVGFNFDDPGTAAEMGSDLMERLYTIQFVIFGKRRTWAKNIANVIKFAFDPNRTAMPLKDVGEEDQPVIDYLEIIGASAERAIIPEPEPWQENVYTVTLKLQDIYSSALA